MSDARSDMIPQVMTRLLAARQLAHQERRASAAVSATRALAEFLTAKLTTAEVLPEPLNVVLRRFTLEDQRPREAAVSADEPKATDDVTDDLARRVLDQLEVHGLVPGDDADAMECILALLRKHEAGDAHADTLGYQGCNASIVTS